MSYMETIFVFDRDSQYKTKQGLIYTQTGDLPRDVLVRNALRNAVIGDGKVNISAMIPG